MVSIWLCHLLMERDHRLVSVRDWAAARRQTLDALLGVALRDTDLPDDRLANALTMLGEAADQAAMDQTLLAHWAQVYALPTETVRLDSTSTSVSVYHDDPPADGLRRRGHSKDHRPDLAQFKALLASLDPVGLPLACQVVPGNAADDGLYIPAYGAAVRALGRADVLMGGRQQDGGAGHAGAPRGQAERIPVRLPPGARRDRPRRLDRRGAGAPGALAGAAGGGRTDRRDRRAGRHRRVGAGAAGGEETWTERVLVVRSAQMQAGLRRTREEALTRATECQALLLRSPGRGRPAYRTRAGSVGFC